MLKLMFAGNEKWKGMTWGMMPLFAGALTACTYHFFYNSKELEFLVTIQAALTWIGNATLWAAAYRIYKDTENSAPASGYDHIRQKSDRSKFMLELRPDQYCISQSLIKMFVELSEV